MRKVILTLFASLAAAPGQVRLQVSETAGIARQHEPVAVSLGGKERVFYITIGAMQTRTFTADQAAPTDAVKVTAADRVGSIVENAVLRADLSKRMVRDAEEDSGTLRGLTFKEFGVTLLRSQNRMHWAPSFQRSTAKSYSGIGTWHPVQKFQRTITPELFLFTRDGHHQDYPEVRMEAEYRFFAHVPYFLFRSVMSITQSIELYWLRNQEMTMDANFTHVVWPGRDGAPKISTFDDRKEILEKEPIPADTPWVAFVNLDKGFGYGAVVLDYKSSKTAGKVITSINDGVNNGKYWDRRLINQTNTSVTPGDRWEERTAYVLFHATRQSPAGEFLDWEKRLRNPLQVRVVGP